MADTTQIPPGEGLKTPEFKASRLASPELKAKVQEISAKLKKPDNISEENWRPIQQKREDALKILTRTMGGVEMKVMGKEIPGFFGGQREKTRAELLLVTADLEEKRLSGLSNPLEERDTALRFVEESLATQTEIAERLRQELATAQAEMIRLQQEAIQLVTERATLGDRQESIRRQLPQLETQIADFQQRLDGRTDRVVIREAKPGRLLRKAQGRVEEDRHIPGSREIAEDKKKKVLEAFTTVPTSDLEEWRAQYQQTYNEPMAKGANQDIVAATTKKLIDLYEQQEKKAGFFKKRKIRQHLTTLRNIQDKITQAQAAQDVFSSDEQGLRDSQNQLRDLTSEQMANADRLRQNEQATQGNEHAQQATTEQTRRLTASITESDEKISRYTAMKATLTPSTT